MFRPRIIPVLLLKKNGLVKSIQFRKHRYIGDPINAVRIFNKLLADELVFLDIEASNKNNLISLDFIKKVSEESNMPFSVGGGIKNLEDIKKLLDSGADRVIINTASAKNIKFIKDASNEYGASTICVCVDVKKNYFGKYEIRYLNGKKKLNKSLTDYCKEIEEYGAGEIIVQSVDKDGTMSGYDIELVKMISGIVTTPVVALGGPGKLSDLKDCYYDGFANGLAAGSIFVYQGNKKGVLINYPEKEKIRKLFYGSKENLQ